MTTYHIMLIRKRNGEPIDGEYLIQNMMYKDECLDYFEETMKDLVNEYRNGEMPLQFMCQFKNGTADYEVLAYKKGWFGRKKIIKRESFSSRLEKE